MSEHRLDLLKTCSDSTVSTMPHGASYTAHDGGTDDVRSVARIGPNAILQVFAALDAAYGTSVTRQIAREARLDAYLDDPPTAMVDETEVIRLHDCVHERLGADAPMVLADAGLRTGDYILANRIPKLAANVLRWLPARLAAPALLSAIGKHAWTFAGSGTFVAKRGSPIRIAIENNPFCRNIRDTTPRCAYHAATFERLFSALVYSDARVVETRCMASGAQACRFEVTWR